MDRPLNPAWERLGVVLRKTRKGAGITQGQLAKQMQVVPSTISAWECGTRGLQEESARKIDQELGSSGVVLRAWKTANTPTAVPECYEEVEQLEQMMSELREYQSQVVPGLIQTKEYARAANRDTSPGISSAELDEMVKSRMRRQVILEKDPPLIYMVLEANALTRVIGSRKILSDQLERVLSLTGSGVIRAQVVPSNPGCHPGASGPFRVYSFPDKPMVASAEYQQGEILMDDTGKVQRCLAVFSAVQAEAMPPRQSADFIRKVKEELDENTA
ncbi:helix-turn-helix domain-containing protein [Nocardiopsis quinghaiensis]|uniref:helix-turn-helix domain-containing protein n=1 Tax=Nocardiopsis quinghaiensis TaxID=464995 RepID=UPI00123B4D40|nr:helix-turn-helix transcriptional regulator [Nocardiopsis quinghaiensis]